MATEDINALEEIRNAFPGKVYAIAKEKRKTEEFDKGKTISTLEKEIYSEEEYEERVRDTTINYFYALYLLSKCDGFIASSMCSGVSTVRAFNQNKFEVNINVREMMMKNEIPDED